MKSIKPGRGPSSMSAVGSLFAIVFGICWTVGAAQMTGSMIFPIFGVCFIGMAVMQLVYHYKNATGENRYSTFDIVDENEETDPFNERFHPKDSSHKLNSSMNAYCPYCGESVGNDFEFCQKCGKKLPQ